MSRYPTHSATPPEPTYEGDTEFRGIMQVLSPDQLEPGFVHRSENKRKREKSADTRRGTIMPRFANAVAFSAIMGSGIYSNPNGPEVILIATPETVYAIADGTCAGEIPIAAGETLDTPCEFVQAFDKVLLFRGKERIPLEWDGIAAAGFTKIVMSTPDDTTKHLIPNADTAEVFKNRLLVPVNRDDVDVSDVLDYTQFDPLLENFRINMGSADALVRIFPYANASVVMFKERSVLELANFTSPGNPGGATLQKINDSIGLASRRAVVHDGTDLQFMSNNEGIYRVTQVIQDRTQTPPVPISYPIQPTIDRINWEAKHKIVAARLAEYIFWAVPIDGSDVANAMLVENLATEQWESAPDVWTGPIDISNLLVTDYQGRPALYVIDNSARAIYVLGYGKTDSLASGEYPIRDLVESRGYATLGWNAATNRNLKQLQIAVATWNPAIQITLVTDKAGDERLLTGDAIRLDRTQYDIFGKARFQPNNAHGDFNAAGRQDYSVAAAEPIFPGTGIDLMRKQRKVLRFSIQAKSRWVSIRIENLQGSCDVEGVLLESAGSQRDERRAA